MSDSLHQYQLFFEEIQSVLKNTHLQVLVGLVQSARDDNLYMLRAYGEIQQALTELRGKCDTHIHVIRQQYQ